MERSEPPRIVPARPTSVDNWCSKCQYLTKPEQERVQVWEGTRVRYDHKDCGDRATRKTDG